MAWWVKAVWLPRLNGRTSDRNHAACATARSGRFRAVKVQGRWRKAKTPCTQPGRNLLLTLALIRPPLQKGSRRHCAGAYNVAKVLHAGWGFGDSGGVVFADGGSPYYALGIQVAGEGHTANFGPGVVRCDAGTACSFFFQPWWAMEQSVQHVLGGGTLNPVTTQ